MDFLRGPDDDRADAALETRRRAEPRPGPMDGYRVGRCRGCGLELALSFATRCLGCQEVHAWAETNRIACAWIHRAAVGRAP